MYNIKQIAQMAGVSVSTVSRVINNHPYVNEQKRAEILNIIKQFNYLPNSNAIHLVTGKTNVIGVILPLVSNHYYNSILAGIAQQATRHNYYLMVCQTDYRADKELEVLEMLKMKKMDGVIMCAHLNEYEAIEPYTQFGPIVTCEMTNSERISSVYTDHYRNFLMGMNVLIEKGHCHIGYCIGRADSLNSRHRRRAYFDAMQRIEVAPAAAWAFEGCITFQDGSEVVDKWQHMQPQTRPTALLTACTHIAAGIVTAAKKRGIDIPRDLAVVGCDDQQTGELLDITTVTNSSREIGEQAFDLLHAQLINKAQVITKQELRPQLRERLST
ncbi:LacI family DNA-binding transcriptional regulator [Paenibacillus sp. 481]|uniref:LacI family DNA-binding transcriptional regulator n=1 Tax=Paenibacillus sp. 481 TaxID=2835869 RepID=UPI001E492615|nr:LacI family DNA-binding transcriptional regulator [Paenibacillus sp. 481]UHA75580.1 LacI family DNA-binding transcriptional regulator [Paenibacillus sp. 481]